MRDPCDGHPHFRLSLQCTCDQPCRADDPEGIPYSWEPTCRGLGRGEWGYCTRETKRECGGSETEMLVHLEEKGRDSRNWCTRENYRQNWSTIGFRIRRGRFLDHRIEHQRKWKRESHHSRPKDYGDLWVLRHQKLYRCHWSPPRGCNGLRQWDWCDCARNRWLVFRSPKQEHWGRIPSRMEVWRRGR